jgi:hypothetical protein
LERARGLVLRKWQLVLLVLSALLLQPLDAAAAEAARADVRIIGERQQGQQFAEVLEPLLRQHGVAVSLQISQHISLREVLRPPSDTEGLVARIFVDLRDETTIALYISNAEAQSFAFREVRVERGRDELARETTGAVIDAAVGVLLAGGTLELSRERAERTLHEESRAAPTTPTPVATAATVPPLREAPTPTRSRLRPIASYSAAVLSWNESVIAHGPGLSLELDPEQRFSPMASLQYQLPMTTERRPVGARWWALALRAGASATLARGTSSRLGLSLAPGVDAIWLAPRVTDSERASAGSARLIAAAMLRSGLMFEYELASLALGALAYVDLDLLGTRFTVRREQRGQLTIFEPWRARPGLGAAVSW